MNDEINRRAINGKPLASAPSMAFVSSVSPEALPPHPSEFRAPRSNDDTKRRSRWSELWDDVELDVTERLWLRDSTLNSMLSPPWGQFLLSDGSMTVRQNANRQRR